MDPILFNALHVIEKEIDWKKCSRIFTCHIIQQQMNTNYRNLRACTSYYRKLKAYYRKLKFY